MFKLEYFLHVDILFNQDIVLTVLRIQCVESRKGQDIRIAFLELNNLVKLFMICYFDTIL